MPNKTWTRLLNVVLAMIMVFLMWAMAFAGESANADELNGGKTAKEAAKTVHETAKDFKDSVYESERSDTYEENENSNTFYISIRAFKYACHRI